MADSVHDVQLAEAFTRFRSEVREEIRPPGAHAVRHAARRRRIIRLAWAAVAVALAGTGVAVVTTVDSPDHTPSVSPTLSAGDLEGLATLALNALPRGGAAIKTAVTAQTQGEPYAISHVGSSPNKFVKGQEYDLVALCQGRGRVIVAWEVPGGVTGSASVVCGGDVVRARFVPQADGPNVQIRLTPDAEAIGRAGIAVGFIEFQ